MDALSVFPPRKKENPIYAFGDGEDAIPLKRRTDSTYQAWSNTKHLPVNPAYTPISIQESSTDGITGLTITKTTGGQGNNHLAFCCHDCAQVFNFPLSGSVSVDLRSLEETYETPAASMNTPLEMATGLLKLPHLTDSVRSLLIAYTNNPSSMKASLVEKASFQEEPNNYEDVNPALGDPTYDNVESGFGDEALPSKSSSEKSDSPKADKAAVYDLGRTEDDLYGEIQPIKPPAIPRKSAGYLEIGPESETDYNTCATEEHIGGFEDSGLYDAATTAADPVYAALPLELQSKAADTSHDTLASSNETYASVAVNPDSKKPLASTANLILASGQPVGGLQDSALYDGVLDASSQLYGTLSLKPQPDAAIYALGASGEQETYAEVDPIVAIPTQKTKPSKDPQSVRSIIIFPCGHIRHSCQDTNHTGCNCKQSTTDFAGKALLLTLPPEKQIEQVTTSYPSSSRRAKFIALGLLGAAAAGAGIAFAFSSSSSSSSQASSEGTSPSSANCTNELAELAYQNMSLVARNLSYVPLQNVVLAALNASACNTMATVVSNTLNFANMSHVAANCYTSLSSRLSPLKSYLPTAASVDTVRDNLIAAQNDTACKAPAATTTSQLVQSSSSQAPTQPSSSSSSSSSSTQKTTTPTLQPPTQPGPTSTPVTTFFTQLSTAMTTSSTLTPSTTNAVTTFFSTLADLTTHVDTTQAPTTLLTTFLSTLATTISSTQATSAIASTTPTTVLSTFLTSLATSMSTSDTTSLTTLLTTLATTTPTTPNPTTPTTVLTTFLTTLASTSTLATTTASPSTATTTMLTTLLTSLATTIASTTPSPTSTSTTQLTTLLTTLATTVTTLSTTTPPPSPTTILTTLMTTLATTSTQSSSSSSSSSLSSSSSTPTTTSASKSTTTTNKKLTAPTIPR